MNDETEPQAQPALRRDDEPALLVAMFRYGVLGPLLEREDLGAGEVTALVAATAGGHPLPAGPRTGAGLPAHRLRLV